MFTRAVPNIVGVDLGCGMYTVRLGKVDIDSQKVDIDFPKVDEAAHFIPSGMNIWEDKVMDFDFTNL